MRTLCKKALALCLVAALALTCFVGTLSVSAAESNSYDATITVADVMISTPAETATAVLNISIPEGKAGINEAIFDISSTIGSATDVKLTNFDVDAGTAEVEGTPVDDTTTNYNRFILSAYKADDATELNGITSATIEVTFAVAETAVAGKYPITIDVSDVKAADKDEVVINLVYDNKNPAKFIIKCDDGAHTYGNTVVGTPATCGAAGAGTQECSVCGDVKEVVIDATGKHNYTYESNQNGTHDVDCPNCDTVFDAETCVDENQDKSCDKCNADLTEDEPECEHQNATKTVTTQPTKDAEGVMTYTCECGHSWTESIPVATHVDKTKMLAHAILFTSSVSSEIAVNFNHNSYSVSQQGYKDFYMVVEYKKYNNDYFLEDKTKTYKSSDVEYYNNDTTKTIHYFTFTEVALFEMAVDYTVYLYLIDENGVAVNYIDDVTNISAQALASANKYSSNISLVKCYVDMVYYGKAAQDYFALQNPGSHIATAASPVVGFEQYEGLASQESDLPASFNNTNSEEHKVDGSTLRAVGTLIIGASNQIEYSLLAKKANYNRENLELTVSYTGLYEDDPVTTGVVKYSDLEDPVEVSSGTKYLYVFENLAIYDLEETVTISVKYNGVEELVGQYSVGAYVTKYLNNPNYASMHDLLVKMELFAQSARNRLLEMM